MNINIEPDNAQPFARFAVWLSETTRSPFRPFRDALLPVGDVDFPVRLVDFEFDQGLSDGFHVPAFQSSLEVRQKDRNLPPISYRINCADRKSS